MSQNHHRAAPAINPTKSSSLADFNLLAKWHEMANYGETKPGSKGASRLTMRLVSRGMIPKSVFEFNSLSARGMSLA